MSAAAAAAISRDQPRTPGERRARPRPRPLPSAEPGFSVAQWLNNVYSHPDRPPAMQRDVLTALAVHFVDWGTGTGFASISMLAEFTRHTAATVKRALRWGREALMIVQTRRGHRLGNGKTMASEWRLEIPPARPVAIRDLRISTAQSLAR